MTTVNKIETGKRRPDLDTLDALLAALGADLHDLADALDEVNGRSPADKILEGVTDQASADAALDRLAHRIADLSTKLAEAMAENEQLKAPR